MMKKNGTQKDKNMVRIAAGTGTAFIIASLFLSSNRGLAQEFVLYDVLPFYEISYRRDEPSFTSLFEAFSGGGEEETNRELQDIFGGYEEVGEERKTVVTKLENTIDYNRSDEGDVIGYNSVLFQTDEKQPQEEEDKDEIPAPFALNPEYYKDINFLRGFYTLDKDTAFTKDDFGSGNLMEIDLKVKNLQESPKVLIFHTHAYEGYSDSDPDNLYDGVFGVGDLLKKELEENDISVLHITERFDLVGGKVSTVGAYERMETVITKIIEENPSIEVVIDIHRDGIPDDVRLVTSVDGESTAKVMFVNGLSRISENGVVRPITILPNPNLETNLAFSLQMQVTANNLYPGLMRNIYLKAYRYSLHMAPRSLLIEVGAQTNTKQEAFNAVKPIAQTLISVIAGK